MAGVFKNGEKMGRRSRIYPDFFKVYLAHLSSQRMIIPPAFVASLNNMMPEKITLRNRSGRLWQVEVVKTETDVSFVNGWENFVRESSLEEGDFLVFRYNEDCIFDFKIYGRSACEKEDTRPICIKPEMEDEEEQKGSGKNVKNENLIEDMDLIEDEGDNDNGNKEELEGEEEEEEGEEIDDDDDGDDDDDDDDYYKEEEDVDDDDYYKEEEEEEEVVDDDDYYKEEEDVDDDDYYKEEEEEEVVDDDDYYKEEEEEEVVDDDDYYKEEEEEEVVDDDDKGGGKAKVCGTTTDHPKKGGLDIGKCKTIAFVNIEDENEPAPTVDAEKDIKIEVGRFQSQNPYFVASHESRRGEKVQVPLQLLRDFNIQLPPEMIFCDPIGRECRGEVTVWKDGRTWIGGWGAFCRRNHVDEHDKCICELMHGRGYKGNLIQIHIVRAGEGISNARVPRTLSSPPNFVEISSKKLK